MKTRTKFLIFISIAAVFFVFVVLLLVKLENNNLNLLQKQVLFEQQQIFDKLIKIMEKTQVTFASDYSWWDAAAEFIKTKNLKWADDNLKSGLKTYSSDFVWAYDPGFNLVYSAASSEGLGALVKNPFNKETLSRIFYPENKFCDFFISSPAGIVEIHGALIVYESDPERENPPEGFLLVGRLWNTKFLEELSYVSGSSVSFFDEAASQKQSDKALSFIVDLKSWDQKSAARILVQKEISGLAAFEKATKDILLLIGLFWSLLFVMLFLFFRKWIIGPLGRISKTLEKEDERYIAGLEKKTDEFGQIAKLIKQFVKQKNHLAHEIKQREQIAAQLEQEKDKAQNYLSVASVIIVALNTKGEVVLINRKGCEILGREEKDILNLNWFDNFLSEASWFEVKNLFEQMMAGKKELSAYSEYEIRSKNGKEKLIAWHNVYLRDKDNNIVEILSSGEDISARTEIEKSQRFAQLGRFVSRMAHEVNNPLMIISGRAQLSLMENPDNLEIKNNLDTIMAECQRAKEIIMRLLKFSKPGKKEAELIELNKIVEESIVLIEHQFRINNIVIVRNYADSLPLIKINSKELQEVMMNLLMNAEDAITGKGNITVKTYEQNDFVQIAVSDTGKGMSSDVIEKAFDPFFTTKDTGTGLGLAVSYSVIKANKGDIVIKSLLGKGTTVTLMLQKQ